MRPHRASLDISIIGANDHLTPCSVASMAAIRAPSCISSGWKVAACPNGMGSMVLKPCTTSRVKTKGIPVLDCLQAISCNSLTTSGSVTFITEPISPLRINTFKFSIVPRPSSWLSCPTFSRIVMLDRVESIFCSKYVFLFWAWEKQNIDNRYSKHQFFFIYI